MRVEKLLDLIVRQSLYFTSLHSLRMGDPYEGFFVPAIDGVELPPNFDFSSLQARPTYVSCWHVSEVEPAGLWKIYSDPAHGIAIQSSLDRLRRSLSKSSEIIFSGVIHYTDDHDASSAAFQKRKHFQFESESRLAIVRSGQILVDRISGHTRYHETNEAVPSGIHIACDIGALIEKILVGPETASWVLETIRLVIEKFGFSFPDERSKILMQPTTGSETPRPKRSLTPPTAPR